MTFVFISYLTAHIPFDDAMETPANYPNLRTINDFVRQLMEIVEEAGRLDNFLELLK